MAASTAVLDPQTCRWYHPSHLAGNRLKRGARDRVEQSHRTPSPDHRARRKSVAIGGQRMTALAPWRLKSPWRAPRNGRDLSTEDWKHWFRRGNSDVTLAWDPAPCWTR